jgi:hypothetical protein
MFVNTAGRQEDSLKLARVVARGMENRRHMVRRCIEKYIINPTVKANEEFTSEPKLMFYPKRIALDFDINLATFFLDLRDRGEISRDTMLSEFDFDQAEEARKRKIEKERYDSTFETAVPYSGNLGQLGPNAQPQPGAAGGAGGQKAGNSADPKAAGRNQGGNRAGGGGAKASPNRGKSQEQQA